MNQEQQTDISEQDNQVTEHETELSADPQEDELSEAEETGTENEAELSENVQEDKISEEQTQEAQIKKLTEDLEKAQADLLRERAELENFKRRSAKASSDTLKYASSELIKELLPVLDSLGKAIESAQNEDTSVTSIREGVEMVYKMAQDALTKHGVTQINPVGEQFDPNQHQAVGMVASEEVPEEHVVDVMQKGYMLYERVLRAAMVRVSQK